MLKPLLSVQLRAQLASFTGKSRKKKRGSAAGYAFLLLYAAAAFLFLFYQSFAQLADAFAPLGLGWLYWAMYGIMAYALMFIGSVFTAKSQLFEAKDNELLLSMPIRPSDILLSRIAILLALDLLFELLVAIPAGLAWVLRTPAGAMEILAFVLLLLALPLLAAAVTCLFAWVISLITARMQKKTLVTMVLSIVFFGAYFVVCFRMNTYITELAANGAQIAGKLHAVAPVYWLGRALCGDGAALGLTLALCILPFAAACWLLARSFIHIVTQKRGAAKIRYDGRAQPVRSVRSALLHREFRRLTSSAPYMMNDGLGLLFLLAMAVGVVWKRTALLDFLVLLGMDGGDAAVLALTAMTFLQSMILFTASSISMEGKTYPILRAMPVQTRQILHAKLRMQLILALPLTLVLSALLLTVTGAAGWLLLPASAALCVDFALFGLIANLRHANLDWVNEIQPIKQGAAVMITMFLGWGAALLIGLPYLFWLRGAVSGTVYLAAAAVLLWALAALMLRWLHTRGIARFESLA